MSDLINTHRWNVVADGEYLEVCRGHHEKGEDCEWEQFVPASTIAERDAEIARLSAERDHERSRAQTFQATVERLLPQLVAAEAALATREAENAELRKALREMVYETTHLSPLEDDGSHWCKISKGCLAAARAALTNSTETGGDAGRSVLSKDQERGKRDG